MSVRTRRQAPACMRPRNTPVGWKQHIECDLQPQVSRHSKPTKTAQLFRLRWRPGHRWPSTRRGPEIAYGREETGLPVGPPRLPLSPRRQVPYPSRNPHQFRCWGASSGGEGLWPPGRRSRLALELLRQKVLLLRRGQARPGTTSSTVGSRRIRPGPMKPSRPTRIGERELRQL